MDGLDEAQKPVVLSDSEPSDGMPSESDDDDDPDGREVVDLSDGEYRAPGEYVPVANKKKPGRPQKGTMHTMIGPPQMQDTYGILTSPPSLFLTFSRKLSYFYGRHIIC